MHIGCVVLFLMHCDLPVHSLLTSCWVFLNQCLGDVLTCIFHLTSKKLVMVFKKCFVYVVTVR